MQNAVTKSEFAELIGVSRGRVSQMLAARQIDGDAIVGEGRSARINVEVARAQLDARLDLGQRLGANGRVKLGGASSDPTEAAIKRQRLAALELANERARAEAAARSGHYVEADGMRQELGRVAGRLVAGFEGSLPELAAAIASQSSMSQRDALHVLRTAWRAIRTRLSGAEAEAAAQEPETLEAAQ